LAGTPAEQLKVMREGLERLKQLGVEAIEDGVAVTPDRSPIDRLRDVLLGAVLMGCVAAPDRVAAQPAGRSIGVGEAHLVRSAILDEDREVQVALPDTYARTTIAYPVLVLLDGSSHLLHATATARFLAGARNRVPEMIVVAIPNRNRNRDMTPGPGAGTFERVLAEELIPWIERHYRAAPERVLVGHSLSASFAVHAMLNRPELFDAYVAASAPLWRYDGLEADIKAGLPRAGKAGATVYLTIGEHENERLREGVRRFAAVLAAAAGGDAPAWRFEDLAGEDHSSTPMRSLYGALEARYAEWRFPFYETQAELDQACGLPGLEAHYQRVSTQLGFRAPPPGLAFARWATSTGPEAGSTTCWGWPRGMPATIRSWRRAWSIRSATSN
jgi:predicted alpha/beta superfamily hydrolase